MAALFPPLAPLLPPLAPLAGAEAGWSTICAMCAHVGARYACSRCGMHAYCDHTCQRAHGATHNAWCVAPSAVRVGAAKPLGDTMFEAWRGGAALSVWTLRALRPRGLFALVEGGVLEVVLGHGAVCALAPRLIARLTSTAPLQLDGAAVCAHPRIMQLVHTLLVYGRARRIDARTVHSDEPLTPSHTVLMRGRVFYGAEDTLLGANEGPVRLDGTDADPSDGARDAAWADDDTSAATELRARAPVHEQRVHERHAAAARNARSTVLDLVLARVVPGRASGARRVCVRAHVRSLDDTAVCNDAIVVSLAQMRMLLAQR